MKIEEYDRQKAIAYAKKWAYFRNPDYYNYEKIGGDCTNFISQCLYHANNTMNHGKEGWYYYDANRKSPSWTGVKFLAKFLLSNKGVGPFAKKTDKEEIEEGDIVQLAFKEGIFSHSLIVVQKEGMRAETILTATHSFDSYARDISTYTYVDIRFLHIEGVRK